MDSDDDDLNNEDNRLLDSQPTPNNVWYTITARQFDSKNSQAFSAKFATRCARSLKLNKYRNVQKLHRNGINTLDIDHVEGSLLSGASDGGIAIHDLHNASGQPQYTCPIVSYQRRCFFEHISRAKHVRDRGHMFSVETVQWYPPDTGLFTSSSFDKMLKVWDTNRMIPAETVNMKEKVYTHHMSPCATKHCNVAVGTVEPYVYLVDLKTGSKSHILKGHKGKIICVRWSPHNEYLLATGSSDQRIHMWDIRSSKGCLMSLDKHNSSRSQPTAHASAVHGLCFSDDGLNLISYGADFKLRLWDAVSGRCLPADYGHVPNYSQRRIDMALSQNCTNPVIYMPVQQKILAYNLHTGEKLGQPKIGHFNDILCCAYSGTTHELYSGGNDRNILVWSPEQAAENKDYEQYLQQNKNETIADQADNWSDDEGVT